MPPRSTERREPWVYGEPYTTYIGNSLRLRARLLPYLYTLAWEATQRGWPLARPIFWDTPADHRLWEIGDAFLLGSTLLAAPILEAGQLERGLLLPAGEWRNYWTGELLKGPVQVRLPARQEVIPLLVREGSILPVNTAYVDLERSLTDPGELDGALLGETNDWRVYQPGLEIIPNASGHAWGQWYEDAGDGPPDAPGRLDEFSLEPVGGAWALSRKSSGEYPYGEGEIELICKGDWQPVRARVDGEERPVVEGMLRAPVGFQQIIFWAE